MEAGVQNALEVIPSRRSCQGKDLGRRHLSRAGRCCQCSRMRTGILQDRMVGSLDFASLGLAEIRGLRIAAHATPVFDGWDPDLQAADLFYGAGVTEIGAHRAADPGRRDLHNPFLRRPGRARRHNQTFDLPIRRNHPDGQGLRRDCRLYSLRKRDCVGASVSSTWQILCYGRLLTPGGRM